ncbi:MAG TPA: mechanosensitive ion channel domain-containing protein [Gammaproteobacteria bacterium]|nr:mechanosensitive ion channel domain-containing protein [Gammaproteobacteria bacterium]
MMQETIMPYINKLTDTQMFINVIAALAIFFIGWWVARIIRKMIVGVMKKKNIDAMLVSFTSNIAYIALFTFVLIAALGELGIQTTSLIVVLSAAGLAIGLSLQGSLSNFASGIMIIFFRPFKVGDYVETAGTAGMIEGIQIFFTQLRTPDNKSITIPNSSITSGNIINYSAKDKRRVDLVFGVSYNDNIKTVKEILEEMLKEDGRILAEPAPTIAVSALADSSVNFICRPWVKTDDYWPVYWDLVEKVKLRFDQEGINIPYPQRDVHLHQVS